jgi:cytochrome c oxidase subunit 4
MATKSPRANEALEEEHHDHVLSPGVLLGTAAALLTLTVITVAVARTDLGRLNVVIALGIASIKATLVAAWFMHLRYEKRINAVVLVVSILFAVILAGFVLFDTTQYQSTIRKDAPSAPPSASH